MNKPFLFLVLQGVLTYSSQHLKLIPIDETKPAQSRSWIMRIMPRIQYRWLILTILCIVLQWVLFFNISKEQDIASMQLKLESSNTIRGITIKSQLETSNLTYASKVELSNMVSVVESKVIKIPNILDQYQDIIAKAYNQHIPAEVVQKMNSLDQEALSLNTQLSDMSSWKTLYDALLKRRSIAINSQNEPKVNDYEQAVPSFDYFIKKIIALTKLVATSHNDNIICTYTTMPSLNTLKKSDTTIGSISLSNNSHWHFTISINLNDPSSRIDFIGNGNMLGIVHDGRATLKLATVWYDTNYVPGEYKKALETELKLFMEDESRSVFK